MALSAVLTFPYMMEAISSMFSLMVPFSQALSIGILFTAVSFGARVSQLQVKNVVD